MPKSVDIRTFTKTVMQVLNEELKRALAVLGEECVIRIRNRSEADSWIDHTGNLRSSIGYGVVENGIVDNANSSSFQQIPAKENPQNRPLNGGQKGRDYLNDKAKDIAQYPLGLVVVAGMEYAIYVEALQNKDVIGNTKIWASQNLRSRIEGAMTRATARLQQMVQ